MAKIVIVKIRRISKNALILETRIGKKMRKMKRRMRRVSRKNRFANTVPTVTGMSLGKSLVSRCILALSCPLCSSLSVRLFIFRREILDLKFIVKELSYLHRKNLQHRRDFRHPKPGDRPSRRAAIKAKNKTKKKKKTGDDDDDDEDDEYESSFINDDSDLDPDETFDSSSDSSDDENGGKDDDDFEIDDADAEDEDEKQIKRLKKEAKRFTRK